MTTSSHRALLDDVIITCELDQRPSRDPDHEAEVRALALLGEAMSSDPGGMLQRLVEATLQLTGSDSAGISLLEPGGEEGTFRWVATTGAWTPYSDGTMPREESPCGEVITRETVLLMARPERAFPALLQAQPGISEGLLAPFTIDGAPAGTLWAIKHGPDGRFDAEDARLLTSLVRFASVAHQLVRSVTGAKASLLESNSRLRALARASSDVFYTLSPDMSELRELSGGDFIADTTSPSRAWLRDYVPPEDQARVAAATAEVIRTKGIFELEHRVLQVDGSIGWALSRAVPVLGADGELVEWFGSASDITARKLTEATLQETEERQAFLLKISDALRGEPNAEAIANRALGMLFEHMQLDRCYVGIYRLAEDIAEFPHQVHGDGLPPVPARVRLSDFPEALRIAFNQTLVVDDALEMERFSDSDRASFHGLALRAVIAATLRKGENNPLWAIVAGSASARTWTRGEIALVEDVAERTWAAVERARVETATREKEEKYRTLFDNMAEGFALFDVVRGPGGEIADLIYREANRALERQTGFVRDETIGRPLRDILPPSDAARFIPLLTRAADPGESGTIEEYAEVAGRWFEVTAYPHGAEQVAAFYRDVSERKRSEQAIHDNEEQQVFLLRLSDALRAEPDADAIADRAINMLADHMRLDRCYVANCLLDENRVDITHEAATAQALTMAQSFRLSGFPDAFRAVLDQTLVIDDVSDEQGLSDVDKQKMLDLRLGAILASTLRCGAQPPLWVLVAGSKHPRRWTPGEITLVEEVAERVWATAARARAERALADSEARFRQFSDASTNILWIRDAVTLRMIFASPAFDAIYGIAGPERGGDDRLRAWLRVIEPDCRKTVLDNFRRVRLGEHADFEFRSKRATDGVVHWVHCTDFPLRDATGTVRWIGGLGTDITGAKETADRQGIMVAELQHRTRNLIAVVRSLADRTIGNAASLADFQKRFELRLSALSRVQGLLSHLAAGERVAFDELLRSELAAHGVAEGVESKVTLDGPVGVPLRSSTVQTFALALHELATNAVKYGALAASDGHLNVRWRVQPATGDSPSRLHLEWLESGVAIPTPNETKRGGGYGRELIERALPYQLKAKTSYELGSDGVRCTIAVPLTEPAAGEGEKSNA